MRHNDKILRKDPGGYSLGEIHFGPSLSRGPVCGLSKFSVGGIETNGGYGSLHGVIMKSGSTERPRGEGV